MKKIILTLALAISSTAFSQLAAPRKPINLHLNGNNNILDNSRSFPTGPAMMIGGTAFILAGALTPPIMVGGSTTQKQPFYKQIRMLPIITGSIVFVIGTGVSLGGS